MVSTDAAGAILDGEVLTRDPLDDARIGTATRAMYGFCACIDERPRCWTWRTESTSASYGLRTRLHETVPNGYRREFSWITEQEVRCQIAPLFSIQKGAG